MAFSPIEIPIVLDLETDFVTDFRQTTNSNLLLLKDRIEDLVNNLEIDVSNQTIGTDNPITSIRAASVIMQSTGFVFLDAELNTIASLTQNSSGESVLNVDNLTIDSLLDVDAITANSLTIADGLTLNGPTTNNAPVTNNSAVSESKENVAVTLTDVSGVATGTITLTSTSRQHIYVKLEADTSVYVGGGLVGSINAIKMLVDFDASNPPSQNQTFTIHIIDVVEQGTGASIVADVNAQSGTGIQVQIEAGTNQATTNTILLHSDLAALTQVLAIDAGDLVAYNSNVSFQYIIDENSNDRLMIESLINFEIL